MTTRSRIKLRVVKDRDELRRAAAELILKKILSAVQARGVCSLALSGGSTPGPVYEELGNSDLAAKVPWSRLEIFFADERAVPMDHPESNYRLVMETLLKSHPEAVGQTFRMPADAADKDQAARRYARRLPDPLDVLVLGMGPDGHTASLFPESPALDEQERRVMAVVAPKPPPDRMTITPSVIQKSRSIVMIVAGVEKAHMVSRVLSGKEDPKTVPAVLAEMANWVVDYAAAGNVLNP